MNKFIHNLFIGLFLIVIALLGMVLVLWFNKNYIEDIKQTKPSISYSTSSDTGLIDCGDGWKFVINGEVMATFDKAPIWVKGDNI